MHYVYAVIFGVLVGPIELVARVTDGYITDHWHSFDEAVKAGALFAYAAIVSCDALMRTSLIPSSLRDGKIYLTIAHGSAWAIMLISILAFVIMFKSKIETLPSSINIVAILLGLSGLGVILIAIYVDSNLKAQIERGRAPVRAARGMT